MGDNLRDIYDTFLDSGELTDVMPEAVGLWEKDKKVFSRLFTGLDKSLDDSKEDITIGDWEDSIIGFDEETF